MKHHKLLFVKLIFATTALLLLTGSEFFDDESYGYSTMENTAFALPMQAHLCEVAGVGNVTGVTTNGFTINVDTWLWNEISATNPLHVAVKEEMLVPTNTPVVFLASTVRYGRGEWDFDDRLNSIYSFMFKMHEMADYTNVIQRGDLRLLEDRRSWFRADEENGKLLTYASNLVHYAKVNTNEWSFYEIVRDGANTTNQNTKIFLGSYYANSKMPGFFSDEMAKKVWETRTFSNPAVGMANSEYPQRLIRQGRATVTNGVFVIFPEQE